MKRKITILILTLLIVVSVCSKTFGKAEIGLTVDKTEIMPNEEFTVSVNMEETQVAAFTIWIYFDTEKVECLEKKDSINIIDNRIIYTWFSETGEDQKLDKALDLKFRAKKEGTALFSVVGEFYNQRGESINMEYGQLETQIKEKTSIKRQNGTVDKDNAELDIMRLGVEGIVPNFSPEITEYYLTVDKSVKKLEITAIPQNGNAVVKISGNKNLKNGLNTIKILVTSENNKNKKEYTINVTRTDNAAEANSDLETLAIENSMLMPEYQANVTYYSAEVAKDMEKLNILAIPSDENANVKITGGDKLVAGDNKLEIVVTARNGMTTKKYVVNVHKRTEDEEKVEEQEKREMSNIANEILEQVEQNEETEQENLESEEIKQDGNIAISVMGSVLAVMIMGIVVLRIFREKKKIEK